MSNCLQRLRDWKAVTFAEQVKTQIEIYKNAAWVADFSKGGNVQH